MQTLLPMYHYLSTSFHLISFLLISETNVHLAVFTTTFVYSLPQEHATSLSTTPAPGIHPFNLHQDSTTEAVDPYNCLILATTRLQGMLLGPISCNSPTPSSMTMSCLGKPHSGIGTWRSVGPAPTPCPGGI